MDTPIRIALVGAGPRGTIMLGRICANAEELAPGQQVEVHLIDPYPPGGGRVWNTGQDRSLLMNTVTGDVTAFTDDTVTCEGPLSYGPTLYQWAAQVARGEIAGQDEAVVREAATLRAWSYASRAFQGSYLSWAVEHFIQTAPAGVRVTRHRTRAIGLEDVEGGRQSLWLEGRSEPLTVDSVVINQGHFEVSVTSGQAKLADFAARHGLRYVPPANPAEVDLDGFGPGEPVILRGLGLNFFDYMTLFSVGRGGRYERDGERLVYRPSGREPLLIAGSGRGVPYHARAETFAEVNPRYQPTFLNAEAIAGFRKGAGTGDVDFVGQVWPLVAKEAGWVYYRSLLRGEPSQLARFETEYPALSWSSPEAEQLIAELVPDTTQRWDWNSLDRPADGLNFSDRAAYLDWIRARLQQDYTQSKLGPAGSAMKATAAMMRDLRDEVRQVISHRGLSGSSYRQHIDGWFSGMTNFFASGPPASRIEELTALVDAGIVSFAGPSMRVVADEQAGVFRADSPVIAQEPVDTAALIEAHLPLTDLRRTTDPLLRYLLDRGECRPHEIPNPDSTAFETGGLDITPLTHQVIRGDGTAHPGRFSYGPPVESVQWVTAIGARPHVNSRTLLQADVIARKAMANGVSNQLSALLAQQRTTA